MKKSALLPVGENAKTSETLVISKGDILELVNGKTVTFLELRRTKFIALNDGKELLIPIYFNKELEIPFIKKHTRKVDESVFKDIIKSSILKKGDLFSINKGNQAFMYIEEKNKKIKALDISNGRKWTIDEHFTFSKIDITELRNKIK